MLTTCTMFQETPYCDANESCNIEHLCSVFVLFAAWFGNMVAGKYILVRNGCH